MRLRGESRRQLSICSILLIVSVCRGDAGASASACLHQSHSDSPTTDHFHLQREACQAPTPLSLLRYFREVDLVPHTLPFFFVKSVESCQCWRDAGLCGYLSGITLICHAPVLIGNGMRRGLACRNAISLRRCNFPPGMSDLFTSAVFRQL